MDSPRRPRGRRPRGAEETRQVILEAARALFAERGFADTTMRAVAARADVDTALIHYYFEDKDGLLNEAVIRPINPAPILDGLANEAGPPGRVLVSRLLAAYETTPDAQQRIQALIRSGISHEAAATALRELLTSTVLKHLSRLVDPDEAELRAALVGSQIAGLLLGRYILRLPPLADTPREVVAAAVGPTITHYLSGPLR